MTETSATTPSNLNSSLQAILWDFGGVFTSSPFEAFNELEAEVGAPKDFIRHLNATNPEHNAWAKFESSAIGIEEFDTLFAEESALSGHRIEGKKVIAMLSGTVRPRMAEVLKICKRHFKVACITNNVKAGHGPGMSKDQAKADAVAEIMGLFDFVIESSLEGIRKPNPAIYTLALDRLGVAAEATLFLDDLGINLKPARAMGMSTIKVLNEQQAIRELEQITGLAFP